MKTVAVSLETWQKLKELKERMGFQSFNELIETLIERWHLTSLKEELSKIDLNIEYKDAKKFIEVVRAPRKQG
ncbi:MAG: hypothetical protein QXE81_05115 [Desulfurococcaceae archaeon]